MNNEDIIQHALSPHEEFLSLSPPITQNNATQESNSDVEIVDVISISSDSEEEEGHCNYGDENTSVSGSEEETTSNGTNSDTEQLLPEHKEEEEKRPAAKKQSTIGDYVSPASNLTPWSLTVNRDSYEKYCTDFNLSGRILEISYNIPQRIYSSIPVKIEKPPSYKLPSVMGLADFTKCYCDQPCKLTKQIRPINGFGCNPRLGQHFRSAVCNAVVLLNPDKVYKGKPALREKPKFGLRKGYEKRCDFELVIDKFSYQACNPITYEEEDGFRDFHFIDKWEGDGLSDECVQKLNEMKMLKEQAKQEKKTEEKRKRVAAELARDAKRGRY